MAQPSSPKIPYWHLWIDDEGVSHQTRCELTHFDWEGMGGKAEPQWNNHLLSGKISVLFVVLPVGWIGDWHANPKPQWISVLSGRWFVEAMDGTRVEMGQGEVSFGGDQNAKADAEGRVGHRSGTLGEEACSLMLVQLAPETWADVRPGAFK